MKKAVLYITMIFSIQSFCQNNGSITYHGAMDLKKVSESYNSGKYDTLPSKRKDIIKKILESNHIVEFTLDFKDNKSKFKQVKKLKEDDGNLNLASIIGGKGIIYTDLSQNIILDQKEAFGELFLVESKIDSIKWKLTKETKTINDFVCYKATTVKKIKNSSGVHEKEVIAWYTPSISANFGPAGYCNLPGLILELKVGKFIYQTKKINLKIINIKITKPTKGEKVSIEEFDDIGLEMSERLIKN
ncbi:GLPGLI family protein [Olleya sp. 1-3]|uniref:GLPGLI family protein n=1 Tax=Olleya sp. 1-3 TaxID=2058323 RepID=UPI000C31D5A7|nr:GLPGLI family protein [Olleya sp. 1-3]PKG52049.1 hypothetical protein CXF54_05710 [Olleya sp. 1-3]